METGGEPALDRKKPEIQSRRQEVSGKRESLQAFYKVGNWFDNLVYRFYTIDIKKVRDSAAESIQNPARRKQDEVPILW